MPLYSKESLDLLRERVDLLEVVSAHIPMQKSGASYKACCPFHEEKSPSFMMQRGDKHYHCFGCGAHGDAIAFLMGYVKMSFIDALEYLAERFQVRLERIEQTSEDKGPSKTQLKSALDKASRYYHFFLLHTEEGQVALRYLYERGIDLSLVVDRYFFARSRCVEAIAFLCCLAVALAQLTRSAINQFGTASTIVLADGASTAVCDQNTAITANPLGGTDLITSTNFDVILTYTLE
jgi:hypothetical protein